MNDSDYFNTTEGPITETQHRDIVNVLAKAAPNEARYVRNMLRAGNVTGGAYVRNDYDGQRNGKQCGCLLGSILIKRHGGEEADELADHDRQYTALGLRRGPHGTLRPAEHAFAPVRLGETPETNARASVLDNVLTELMLSNPDVYGRTAR